MKRLLKSVLFFVAMSVPMWAQESGNVAAGPAVAGKETNAITTAVSPVGTIAKPLSLKAMPASAGLAAAEINARDFAPKAEGQAGRNKTFYKWSVVAVGAANAADTFSSWGQSESNPALGGTFGGKSMALKAAFIGTSFVIERVALRHNPKLYKSLGWLNMAVAGGLGAAAAHNVQIR